MSWDVHYRFNFLFGFDSSVNELNLKIILTLTRKRAKFNQDKIQSDLHDLVVLIYIPLDIQFLVF